MSEFQFIVIVGLLLLNAFHSWDDGSEAAIVLTLSVAAFVAYALWQGFVALSA